MLRVFTMIAFILDALVFIYILLKSYAERGEITKINNTMIKKTEENFRKSKSKPEMFGIAIGIFLFSLILLGIGIMPFIALTVKWIQEGFVVGLRYFLIYSLFWPLFNAFMRTFKKKSIMNERHRLTIWMFLSGVFISIMYTIFGLNFTIFEVISFYSNSNFLFSNTLSIIMPSLLIFSVVLTFYSAISKISLQNIKDNYYPHWTIKYPFVLTILVASIYASLIYMSELNFTEKTSINYFNMNDTIYIIQNLLTAALIPLIVGIFFNVNTEKMEKKLVEISSTNIENSSKENGD